MDFCFSEQNQVNADYHHKFQQMEGVVMQRAETSENDKFGVISDIYARSSSYNPSEKNLQDDGNVLYLFIHFDSVFKQKLVSDADRQLKSNLQQKHFKYLFIEFTF